MRVELQKVIRAIIEMQTGIPAGASIATNSAISASGTSSNINALEQMQAAASTGRQSQSSWTKKNMPKPTEE